MALSIDLVILIVSLFMLVALLKPFTFPGGETVEDTGSVIVTILAILAYFYGVDFFPVGSPIGFLHIITIGLVNAMAMIDLFITTTMGIPLSLSFIFVIVLPAMIMFRLSRAIMKYVAVFSDRTTYFIAMIVSFLTIVGAVTGTFNLVHWFFAAIAGLVAFFLSGTTILSISVNIFIACVVLVCLGVLFESMTTLFMKQVANGVSSS